MSVNIQENGNLNNVSGTKLYVHSFSFRLKTPDEAWEYRCRQIFANKSSFDNQTQYIVGVYNDDMQSGSWQTLWSKMLGDYTSYGGSDGALDGNSIEFKMLSPSKTNISSLGALRSQLYNNRIILLSRHGVNHELSERIDMIKMSDSCMLYIHCIPEWTGGSIRGIERFEGNSISKSSDNHIHKELWLMIDEGCIKRWQDTVTEWN